MLPFLEITPERVIEVCGEPTSLLCEFVLKATESELAAELVNWLVARPLRIGIIILVAVLLNRLLHAAIRRMTSRMISEDLKRRREAPRDVRTNQPSFVIQAQRTRARAEAISGVLRSVSSGFIYTIATITALAEVGVAVTPLLAGAGTVGIALAFGAQKLVGDFLSGFFMLAEDQYGLGDYIDTGFCVGQVESVSLRTTRVRDVNGTLWHIPNGEIRRIGNMSQEWARTILDIDVAYATDIQHARRVIEAVFETIWDDPAWRSALVEEPEVWGVENFGADGVTIRAVIKTEPAPVAGRPRAAVATQRSVRRRGHRDPVPAALRLDAKRLAPNSGGATEVTSNARTITDAQFPPQTRSVFAAEPPRFRSEPAAFLQRIRRDLAAFLSRS